MAARKGQALVETVIVLPLILFILFAIISFGIYIYDLTVFTMASNKGMDAMLGALGNSEITDKELYAEERAEQFAGIAIFVDDIRADVYDDGASISVNVEGDFNFILPFMNEIFGDIFLINSECTYIYEGFG